MSRIMRCNRCGAEQEAELNFSFSKGGEVTGLDNWARVMVIHKSPQPEVMGRRDGFDLCEDCREILVEQFFKGAAVAPITRSEEHTSELQSLMRISYAVFCLKK